jgi:hypothetical protein
MVTMTLASHKKPATWAGSSPRFAHVADSVSLNTELVRWVPTGDGIITVARFVSAIERSPSLLD